MPAVRDARSPPRMALIAADETESPFVVIVPQGFHNCTHARKCALQPTPPLPQLVPKASAFFWLHGRTRLHRRANEVGRADLRVCETPPETRASRVDVEDGVGGPVG